MDQPRSASDFDPQQPETFDSPHAVYADLRGKCPVAHSDAFGGFWAVTTYEDVARVASDYRTFTTTVQNVVPKVSFTGRRPPLHLDPPDHTPYRRALNPTVSDTRIKELEAPLRAFAAELLQPLIDRGGGDIAEEFAHRFPVYVFGEYLHVPPEFVTEIREILTRYNRALQSWRDEVVRSTSLRLYEMARDLIELRKTEPLDPESDPVSALLAARDPDGQPLPDDLVLGTVRQILVVGMLAPTVMIGSIVVHLARDHDLQERLRRDSALIPAAVEEFLRLYSPYRGFARTARHDVEIGGVAIKAGEPIALLYTSADRDGSVFADPDRFDLDRDHRKHLAFGRGAHSCLGAPLARLELRIALEEILARTTSIELAGDVSMTLWPEYGALQVPVRVEANLDAAAPPSRA